MKIAIVSDSHDYIDNTSACIQMLRDIGVDALIHCGDICAPFIIKQFSELDCEQHFIQGNNHGDPFVAGAFFERFENMSYHGVYAELEFDGVRFAAIHYPGPALRIAQSGKFDVVCFGHTHVHEQRDLDGCLLVNPGAIMGNAEPAQFVVYDTSEKSCTSEILTIK